MKNFFTIIFCSLLFIGLQAQDSVKKDKKEKTSEEKTSKEKKEKNSTEKIKAKDDTYVFQGEPEGDEYQLEDRREISKPSMPLYDVDQDFNQQSKKKVQQDAFNDNDYFFPAKPKNAWMLGLRGGIALVNGDVSQNFFKGNKPPIPGYTAGLTVTKPFSYVFSIRGNYNFMQMWNTDWQRSTLTENQISNTNYELASYINNNPFGSNQNIFQNSRTTAHELTMDAVFTVGNIRYHKERAKVVFNFFLSGGGFLYKTSYDQFDENGLPYDYLSIPTIDVSGVSKKDIITALSNMRDGVYETNADGASNPQNGNAIASYTFRPVLGGGFGFAFRLNRFMNLDIEARMMITRDDLLDGVRWQEPDGNSYVNLPTVEGGGAAQTSRGLTRDFDTYTTTTIGLTFKLVGKKKTEPLTMLNPMHYTYQKIAENDPEKAIQELLKDDDEDGVPNRLDQEPNTPAGAPVNPKGIALDSDSDGIIDGQDDEPFSPPGLPVNEKGVAQLPPVKSCCDIMIASACENVILPSIHFDKDKYNIKPEFYAHLYNLAEKMMECLDLKIMATGMTDMDDSEKYNEQLSYNRATAVINYLNEKYGIDKNRFIVGYDGESNAKASSPIEQYKERKVMLEQAPVGASGNGNPAPPHPGLKAGSE